MVGLPFPDAREPSATTDDEVLIDPALIDPALYTVQPHPPLQFTFDQACFSTLKRNYITPNIYIQQPQDQLAAPNDHAGPQGDPFAPQPLDFFPAPLAPVLEDAQQRVEKKKAGKKRKRVEGKCGFCGLKRNKEEDLVSCAECSRSGTFLLL